MITIDLDNDAFKPSPRREVARLLLQDVVPFLRPVEDGRGKKLVDENGNTCGKWEMTEGDEPQDPTDAAASMTFDLATYLLEAHKASGEYESSHGGDADHPGEAPEACSYCRTIASARDILAKLKWDVSALRP